MQGILLNDSAVVFLRLGGVLARRGLGGLGMRDLFFQDAHRLAQALGQTGKLWRTKEQQDDEQDDNEVPSGKVSKHEEIAPIVSVWLLSHVGLNRDGGTASALGRSSKNERQNRSERQSD
jgi:hypothetical protein